MLSEDPLPLSLNSFRPCRESLRECMNYAYKRVWVYKWFNDVRSRFEANKNMVRITIPMPSSVAVWRPPRTPRPPCCADGLG